MHMKQMSAAAVLSMAAAVCLAGWEFTAVTQVEGRGAGQQAPGKSRSWIDGDNMRMEYTEGGNPMLGKDGYTVTTNGGKTMLMIDPREKTYSELDVQAMVGMAGGMMGMMNVKFTQPQVEKLPEERGEAICGYPTTLHTVRSSYAMEMNMMGFKSNSQVTKEERIWATTAVGDLGANPWLKQSEFKTGNEELDKLIKAEMTKVKGFPLKTVTVNTTKDANGKTEVSKTVMEVTELKKSSPPASLFALPPGYKKVPLTPMGAMQDEEGTPRRHGGKHPKKTDDADSDGDSGNDGNQESGNDESSSSKPKPDSRPPVDMNKLLKGFKFGK